MQLRIDTTQFKGVQTLWSRFPEVMRDSLLPVITEIDLLMQGELQQQLPRGAGGIAGGAGLVGSIFTEEQALADNVIGMVASPLPYAEYVELGTKPHFPPIEPLVDWVMAKLGITDETEAHSVAFLIARKIARVGTKPDGTWARVAETIQPEANLRIGRGIDRALDALRAPQ